MILIKITVKKISFFIENNYINHYYVDPVLVLLQMDLYPHFSVVVVAVGIADAVAVCSENDFDLIVDMIHPVIGHWHKLWSNSLSDYCVPLHYAYIDHLHFAGVINDLMQ